ELLRIWGQFDDRVREDSDRQGMEAGDEQLVVRVRNRYSELLIRRNRIRRFKEETGYNDSTNVHEERGTDFIEAEFEPVEQSETLHEAEVSPEESDFLSAYSID